MQEEAQEPVRREQDEDKPFDATTDPAPEGEGGLEQEAGPGGYADRDPRKELPRIPSVPDTQEDERSHSAAPSKRSPKREVPE